MSDHRTSGITHRGPVFSVEVIEFTDARGRRIRKDVVRHPGAVTIIAEDDLGRFVMVRNHRVSIDRPLLEFPAGKMEPDETPLAAARRELLEETGFTARSWRALGAFFTSPGLTDERMHIFHASDLSRGEQRLEAGEEIHVEVIEAGQLRAHIGAGELEDGKTLAAMMLYENFGAAGSVSGFRGVGVSESSTPFHQHADTPAPSRCTEADP